MTKIVGPRALPGSSMEEPTDQGFYIDNREELWLLNDDGWVPLVHAGGHAEDGAMEDFPRLFAPFRKCVYLEYR